jgi:hypothetical protein
VEQLFLNIEPCLHWLTEEGEPQIIQNAKLPVQSSELAAPHPLTRKRVLLPPFRFKGGETHSLEEEGVRGPWGTKFRRRIRSDTLVLYVYYNPSRGGPNETETKNVWADTVFPLRSLEKIACDSVFITREKAWD